MIDQLNVLLPNEPGALAKVASTIGAANIQMHALMVADTADFGIIRIICDTPKAAVKELEKVGYGAITSKIVAVEVPDVPGGLGKVLENFESAGLNIEYGYCNTIGGRCIDFIKLTGDPIEPKLIKAGVHTLKPEEIYVVDAE